MGSKMKKCVAALLLVVAACTFSVTWAAEHVEEFDLSLPRSTLKATLAELSRKTGLGIALLSENVDHGDLVVGPIQGRYSAEAALRLVLNNTNLDFTRVGGRMIVVTAVRHRTDLAETGSSTLAPKFSFMLSADQRLNSGSARDVRQDDSRRQPQPRATAAEDSRAEFTLPEVLVTATTLNRDIRRTRDDIQPYVIYGRETIERSGAQNVEQFLKQRLTMVTSYQSPGQIGGPEGNLSRISLRGLDADETLILIDGHRAAGANLDGTVQQPDLNSIPLAAIERIEVLPTTASAIYGGSATGGVINVVLRRDYSGFETQLTYGNTFDGDASNRRVDLSAGMTFEEGKTNVLVAATYDESFPLRMGERDFLHRGRERLLSNNPGAIYGFFPPLGATTNITSAPTFDPVTFEMTQPLLTLDSGTALGSSITHVPIGYSGAASDAGAAFLANAGHYNLDLANTAQAGGGARQGLLNSPTTKSLTLTLRREFSSRIQGYLDVSGGENSGSFATNNANASFFIPGSAPNNPFEQDIYVTTPMFGADGIYDTKSETRRAVAGVIVKLPGDWQLGADYTWNRVRYSTSSPSGLVLDPLTFTPTADPDVAAGVVDVLRDTNRFPVSFAPYLGVRGVSEPADTILRDTALQVGGPVARLPAGPLTLTARVEHRTETLEPYESTSSTFAGVIDTRFISDQSQETNSLYIEANIPVVSARNSVPGVHDLSLQLAARHDEYDVVSKSSFSSDNPQPTTTTRKDLSSTDPLIGLRYSPLRSVTLRASYGTGFLPPNYLQLLPAQDVVYGPFELAALGLSDPRRGNESLSTLVVSAGGNRDLSPEQSETKSAGVIFNPRAVSELRVSVDWTRIHKTDVITFMGLSQQNLLNESLVPGLVIRGPVPAGDPYGIGPIVGYRQTQFNVANQDVEALDFAVDYGWHTERFGSFSVAMLATHQLENESQIVANAPVVDTIGYVNGLEWQGNLTFSWDMDQWSAAWTSRYYDSYSVGSAGFPNDFFVASQGSETVPSQHYHDVFASYRFGNTGNSMALLSGVQLQLGVRNVFNTKPPVDMASFGTYYSSWGDPRLSSYYLTLRKAF